MIVDLFKEKIMKDGSYVTYEIGMLVDSRIQILLVKATSWTIRNDVLIFWMDAQEKQYRAVFKSWCYIRRVEEEEFVRPLVITKEFIKNQISCARKKPSQNLLLEGSKLED